MSEPPASMTPLELTYEQRTEPDVRVGRAMIGCALVGLHALLLLAFRDVGRGMIFDFLRTAGQPWAWMVVISVMTYGLLSICEPFAAYLLCGAKVPRIQAGKPAGMGFRRAGMMVACGYCGFRLISAGLWSALYVRAVRAGVPVARDGFVSAAQLADVLSSFLLAGLHVAAWLYFADLAARLRRMSFLTAATVAMGIGFVIGTAKIFTRLDELTDGMFAGFHPLMGAFASDSVLCVTHLVFWSWMTLMLRRHLVRG